MGVWLRVTSDIVEREDSTSEGAGSWSKLMSPFNTKKTEADLL